MAPRTKKLNTIDVTDVFPETQQPADTQPPALRYPTPGREPELDDGYDDMTAINTVLSELGALESESKGFITVYREITVGSNKKEEYLSKFDVAEYADGNLLENLQTTYGGGKYHIRVYRPYGEGLAANKWVSVAANPNAKPLPETIVQPAASLDITPIIQTMQEGFTRMFDALKANQPAPAPQPTMAEKLQELQLMRDMFMPTQNSAPVNYNPVEMMKLGMEMAANGGDGNNMWVGKVLETFAPVILESIGKQNNEQRPARAALPAKPQVTGQQQQPQLSNNEIEDDSMNLMLTGYLKMLNSAAKNNKPVEEYADTILNMLPADMLTEFETMLRAPDWQAKFASYSAGVTAYPGWYAQLREVLLAYIDEDKGGGAVLTAEQTGDNVGDHETDHTKPTSD